MLERVARAICSTYGDSEDACGKPAWTLWVEEARAAIESMREPSEAQYEALSATGMMWREMNSRFVWQTYIDATLSSASPAAGESSRAEPFPPPTKDVGP